MNPIEDIISTFQEWVSQVPDLIQPLIVMLAGAVPFVEGEAAALIGVLGGVNPVVAGIAAALGNIVCMVLVVLVASRARTGVVKLSRDRAGVAAGTAGMSRTPSGEQPSERPATDPGKPESKGRLRFKRWLVRFGVPGASILGPLAIPTQFTSAILIASGVPGRWVVLWQTVAIVLWTTLATVSAWAALTFLIGV